MSAPPGPVHPGPSKWALGGVMFAGCVLVLVGIFQAITGLAAIIDDDFFVVTSEYAFDLDTTAWGVIHLLIGLGVLATGIGLFNHSSWAGVAAIVVAMLSAVSNFFFIPYYPAWSILMIALVVWVIWSLTRPGVIKD